MRLAFAAGCCVSALALLWLVARSMGTAERPAFLNAFRDWGNDTEYTDPYLRDLAAACWPEPQER